MALLSKFDFYQREGESNMVTKWKVTFGPDQENAMFF
jgi:hypothetical protein